ncbi:TonB-dependent receptor [Sphingobium sp. BS19]|nr:TonB-dependent receptor [Sphingobium sp. BS19]
MMALRHSVGISAVRTLALASVACCGILASPVVAQEAGVSDDDGGIVVTARRREESLLNVPIAVTAISGDTLERTGAIDITDISNSSPNVTLETSRGTNSTLTAFIRGVGQQDPVAGFEAGVGLYLDDVYLNRPQAAVLDIYDVERIEVLRGPQGTLYGRNTIGGAVKYVTKRLGDDPMLKIRGTYGSYNQADGVITASTPVGNGTLKLGGAVARLSRGGFGDNLTTGDDNYNKDVWAGRLTAQVEAKDAFFRLTGDYTKDKSNPRGGHRLIPGLFTGAPVLNDVYDTRGGLLDPKQDIEAWGVSLFSELKPTDMFTVRSITAYRKDDSATPIDFDSLAAVDVDVPAFYNNKQFSQELQLLIDAGPFNGLIGGYFLDANARTAFDVRLPNGVTALTFGDVDTETFAIFGDFTYDLSQMFSVSVGGRYTWDKRSSTVLRRTYLGGGSPFFGGNGTLFATTSDFTGDKTFKEFTPRASVSFKPSPDHTIYASYAKGFKGGGFDPRGVSTAAPDTNRDGVRSYQEIFDFLSFDPETVESYEVGYKASLFDRRLTMALAAFHADYSDVQVPGSVGAIINGQQTFIGVTTNAGKARIRGIEYEGNLAIARDFGTEGDRLNFNWALGYIDAKYKRFIDSRGIDVADRRKFQNTPKWTASGTLAYSTPIGSGNLNASSTLAYRSASQQFELRTPGLDQGKFALWDASLVWSSESDRFSLGVHGRNLTNKKYIVSGYNFLSQNPDTGNFNRTGAGALIPTLGREGVLTAYYGNPRQVFVTGSVKF